MKSLIIILIVTASCLAKAQKPKKVLSVHTRAPVPTSASRDTIKIETIKTVVDTVTIKDTVIVKEDITGPYKMFITEFDSAKISIELRKGK